MSALQELATQWLTSLGALLPFGFAFGAGIVAAVNPCGFAMLPAYLSLYLGIHEEANFEKHSALRRVLRAALIGGVVSLGFILLFGLAGVIVAAGGSAILAAMPWVGAIIGGALVLMGLWMLAGRTTFYTGIFERFAQRIGDPRTMSVRGFFLFGLAYGLASLSCTLPVFLAVMGGSLTAGSFLLAAGQFVSYGLGMTAVIVILTLALTLFKEGVISRLRKVVPYVYLISAALLMLAGVYIVVYWWPVLARSA